MSVDPPALLSPERVHAGNCRRAPHHGSGRALRSRRRRCISPFSRTRGRIETRCPPPPPCAVNASAGSDSFDRVTTSQSTNCLCSQASWCAPWAYAMVPWSFCLGPLARSRRVTTVDTLCMRTLPGLQGSSALLALGLAPDVVIRNLEDNIGLTHHDAVLATCASIGRSVAIDKVESVSMTSDGRMFLYDGRDRPIGCRSADPQSSGAIRTDLCDECRPWSSCPSVPRQEQRVQGRSPSNL